MSLVAATGDIHLKSVLIATDFSEASEKALRHALAIARHYGAKFYLAHVVSSPAFTLVGPDAVNCRHRCSLQGCPSIGGPSCSKWGAGRSAP